jgi:hypothetical protein
MNAPLHSRLKEILFELDLMEPLDNPSLTNGNSGLLLFKFLFYKHFNKGTHSESFEGILQNVVEQSINISYPTFAGGLSGIYWLLSYLHQNGLIDKEDLTAITLDKKQLDQVALRMLEIGNYDFLHGALGIAYYRLFDAVDEHDLFIKEVYEKLSLLNIQHKGLAAIPAFDILQNTQNVSDVNLSLSHGLMSILKFAITSYEQGICKTESKILAYQIIDFLRNNSNDNSTSGSFYPSVVSLTEEYKLKSRLAWCYGDLSIGLILYQASLTFGDKDLQNHALTILLHTTTRRTAEDTHVADAGLCHGSAGIAHMYNIIWVSTGNTVFKDARDYWMGEAVTYVERMGGIKNYKKFSSLEKEYLPCEGLLEGKIGIGLSILTYLTNDFSWDYCLMLNN